MVLEKIFENKCKEIDKKAKIRKEIENYFYSFINLNYTKLKKAFNEDGEELCNHVRALFDYLEEEYIKPFGISIYNKQYRSPDIKLGLTKYKRFNEDPKSNSLKYLTEKGENLINDYRKRRGLPSIKETNELQEKFMKS